MKPPCDWDDPKARKALVDALVRDVQAALGVVDGRQLDGARDDAESWLSERRKEIDRELWNPGAAKAAKRKPSVTFRAYSDRWLETRRVKRRPLRPRTKAHYRRLLELHILPSFGSKQVRSITPDMVDRWYEHTAVDTPTARAHCYSLLRAIFESACTGRDRIIEINPCLIDGAGTTDRVIKPKPASVEQLGVLVANMPDHLQLMVMLASWCGLRFGGLVELRRADIDVQDGVVNVQRGAVRTGRWMGCRRPEIRGRQAAGEHTAAPDAGCRKASRRPCRAAS